MGETTTTLVLVRHARAIDRGTNGQVRLMGWTDEPLSREGDRQARDLAVRLRGEDSFAALYSSPLRRAVQTAMPIAAALQLSPRVDDGLREIHCGVLDGAEIQLVERRFPSVWAANQSQKDPSFRWPGGESYSEFRRRCVTTLAAIAQDHRGARIIVVTHAGVINQILGHLHGLTAARWEPYRPHNASVSEIEWANGKGRIVRFDDQRVRDSRERAPGLTLEAHRLEE
jgi:alpha-ribazole phosphatase/probable phosphoglycerate mutase